MGRRQVVESVNAALKGAFVDLARGFFRVFGRVKMSVLLGFTLAAYNLDRVRSFRAKHGLEEDGQPRRPSQASPGNVERRASDLGRRSVAADDHRAHPASRPASIEPTCSAARFGASSRPTRIDRV